MTRPTAPRRSASAPRHRLALATLEDRTAPAAGMPDPTFGTGGLVVSAMFNDYSLTDRASDVAVLPDGRIVVGGHSGESTVRLAPPPVLPNYTLDFSFARYQPDGALDPTFGAGGKVSLALGYPLEEMRDLAVQADGKTVAAGIVSPVTVQGSSVVFNTDLVLVRLTGAGAPDPAFGTNGVVIADLAGSGDVVNAVGVQADGKIVVLGSAVRAGNRDLVVLRFLADGTPDPSFGSAGRVFTDLGTTADTGVDLKVGADGAVWVAASVQRPGTGGDFAVVKYLGDGSPDPAFAAGGIALADLGSRSESTRALALQPDGRPVVAGTRVWTGAGGGTHFAATRFNPDGTLDTSFGIGGHADVTFAAGNDGVSDIGMGPGGSIVLSGSTSTGGPSQIDFALLALTPAGVPDPTFGTGGKVSTDFGNPRPSESAAALAVAPDGSVVAVGTADSSNVTGSDIAVARYTPAGSLDPSFGSGGRVLTDFTVRVPSSTTAGKVVVQPDGKILVAGSYSANERVFRGGKLLLSRYNADGTPDTNFGDGGNLIVSGSNGVLDLAMLPDGRFLVLEQVYLDSGSAAGVGRFLPDGALDPTFGDGGWLVIDAADELAGRSDFAGIALRLAADGAVYVAGGGFDLETFGLDPLVVRLDPDGHLDPTFGDNGVVRTASLTADDFYNGFALQPDGRLVLSVGGLSYETGDSLASMTRLNTDGTLDTTFAGTGILDFGVGAADQVVVRPDGRIVLSARVDAEDPVQGFLRQYLPDGTLDPTFGTDGKTPLANFGNLMLQPNGRLVVAGNTFDSVAGYDFFAARYNPDGSPDMTFGDGGQAVFDPGTRFDFFGSAALQPDGNLILTGSKRNPGAAPITSEDDGVIIRLIGDVAPAASAGGPYAVFEGRTVTLDASASSDPNQPTVSLDYAWDLDGDGAFGETGPAAANGDEVGATPTFAAAGIAAPADVTVRLRVTDMDGMTSTADSVIHVRPAAPTDIALSAATVAENQPSGILVGVLSAADPELPDDTLTFALVPGPGADDNAAFAVIGTELRSAVVFNRETKEALTVRVRVTDAGGRTYEEALAVTVLDAAEPAPGGPGTVGGVAWAHNPVADTLVLTGRSSPDAIGIETTETPAGPVLLVRANGQSIAFDGSGGRPRVFAHAWNHPQLITVLARGGNDSVTLGTAAVPLPTAAYERALLDGDNGNNTLVGGAAPDTLHALGGTDDLDGRGGSDTYPATGTEARADRIRDTGTDGTDTLENDWDQPLDLNGFGPANGIEVVDGGGLPVRGTGSANILDFRAARLIDVKYVDGQDGNDVIYASELTVVNPPGRLAFEGYFGDDGMDSLYGGGADDKLFGEAGRDLLVGGAGADTLVGGAGQDTLVGGAGQDTFYLGDPSRWPTNKDTNNNGIDDDEEGLVPGFIG